MSVLENHVVVTNVQSATFSYTTPLLPKEKIADSHQSLQHTCSSQLHSAQPETVAHLIFPRYMSKLTVHICVTESYSVIRRQTGDWEVSQLIKHLPGKHEDSRPQLKKDGHGDTHLQPYHQRGKDKRVPGAHSSTILIYLAGSKHEHDTFHRPNTCTCRSTHTKINLKQK